MPDKPKRYQIANPNGIPEGVRILRTAEKEFFEGDEIAPGDAKDTKDFADLIAQGYVVEVEEKPKAAAKKVTDAS